MPWVKLKKKKLPALLPEMTEPALNVGQVVGRLDGMWDRLNELVAELEQLTWHMTVHGVVPTPTQRDKDDPNSIPF